MTPSLHIPPKLSRFEPSADVSAVLAIGDLPPLPPPALGTWDRLPLVGFYRAHQDLKQDLLKKPIRGVCTIRFRQHCQRIPQRVRELHKIDVPAEGGPRRCSNGRSQSALCRKIDDVLEATMAFWGTECNLDIASEC